MNRIWECRPQNQKNSTIYFNDTNYFETSSVALYKFLYIKTCSCSPSFLTHLETEIFLSKSLYYLLPKQVSINSMLWVPCADCNIWGPFEKFLDSPYYSESALHGGVVTVSFLKYLPWQVKDFLQSSTHFSKMCCRLFAASFKRIVEHTVLTFCVCFSIIKALPPLENCSLSHCIVSIGLMDEF
jgi:hypothetical protein